MVEKMKKMSQNASCRNVREAALDLLHHVFQHPEDGTPVPVLIAELSQSLKDRDVPMLSELVYGVLRRSALLDAVLRPYLRRPASLSPQVMMLLRLGAFEVLFLDSVPERATVNEMVSLVRRRFGQGIAGLINAVLRSLARDKDKVREDIAQDRQDLSSLAEEASLPSWLMLLWEKQYGMDKAMDFARNTRTSPSPCWRVNASRPGSSILLEKWVELGYRRLGKCGFTAYGLPKEREGGAGERVLLDSLEKKGAVTRQGYTSQRVIEDVIRWIRETPGAERLSLWDACCGRGGKTMALMEQGIKVSLASDPSSFRLEDLKKGVERLGLEKPQLICSPAQEVKGMFPLILLDVPCSGTGTLGRVPELRLRLNQKKLNEAVRTQRDIMEGVWPKLECGGMLFYATCALNKEENEYQIKGFLERHDDAECVEQKQYLPLLPGQDAMFLAVLRKCLL